ncbi:hypothetical protein [Pedobacter sp. B4-66]|uniref:hypothetical protein n=1 Tax=Pedobacter sp. B4-66 TaxID=2817280 RepID=UPI001BDA34F5|nr:hypothetical protein [Pedobacter sp. B4-66]
MKTNSSLKTVVIILLSTIIHLPITNAQTNIFPVTGKTGIGTITPASQLEIVAPAIVGGERIQRMRVSDAPDDYLDVVNATTGTSIFIPVLTGNVTSSNSTALMLMGQTDAANDNGVSPVTIFDSRYVGSKIETRPLFAWTSYTSRYMTMLANGNLGIGTASPAEKLSVNGKIRAHEIKVETSGWPDYVFAKGYQLTSLEETEKHIKEKGHLPGIPSAEEVKANGIDLGEMNSKLLKKIEELTLYMIEQNKKIEQQETRNIKLESQVDGLIKEIKTLKTEKQ